MSIASAPTVDVLDTPAPAITALPSTPAPAVTALPATPAEPRRVWRVAAIERRPGAQAAGLTEIWRCFWRSRLLVLAAAAVGVLILGPAPDGIAGVDPTGLSLSFGAVGNLLMAPVVRWDATWYLQIAHSGYATVQDAGFYPLYPLLMHAAGWLTGSLPVAGVLVSLMAMLAALVVVRRLTELELGPRAGDVVVRLISFGPMAVFLSAIYTESLFVALSAGTLYAARRGRWPAAGMLGGLAAATRINGVALLVPVVIMFFYGPRGDRPQKPLTAWWKPRYAPSRAVAWTSLILLGFGFVSAYLSLRGYGAGSTLNAQLHSWDHRLTVPVITVWAGLKAASQQLALELRGGDPALYLSQSLFQSVALVVAITALVAVLRRLPFAYGAYVIVGLLIALSTPTIGDPLKGLARYVSVLFPLQMCAAAWAVERGVQRTLTVASTVLMIVFTVQFATWHMVGTLLI
jgi:hypothetical protein